MTVNANDRRKTYPGNNVATVFNGPRALSESQIQVYLVVAGVATPTSSYTLTGIGNDYTVVTMNSPVPTGTTLLILRTVSYSQGCDISNQGAYLPEVLENAGLDPIVMQTQQLADQLSLAMRLPETVLSFNTTMPLPVPNRFLVYNGAGTGLGLADTPPTADLTLRGDLAATGSGQGADLVALRDTADLFSGATVEAAIAEIALRCDITPERYGAVGNGIADDTAAMQAAVQAAAGKTLRLTPGKTYLLGSGAMRIKSRTRIIAYGATVTRGAATNRFITWDTNGTTGGYDAITDVTILGGTWDGKYPTVATSLTGFGICHSRRTRIHDCYMKNVALNHYIEINSSTDVVISGCTFDGGAEQADDSMEAIQIDGAIDAATFSGGQPFDNTFCSNISITSNTFTSCGTGVGTHSVVSGLAHNNIRIIGNQFTAPYYCGVRPTNWENTVISGNVFYGGLHAVRAFADAATIVRGLAITGNVMQKIGNSSKGVLGDGHAIYVSGNSAGTEQVQDWTIANNVIRDCNEAKSGNGIKVNYSPNGTITGNMIDGVAGTGISVFGNGGINIIGNRVNANGAGAVSISASGLNLLMVANNIVDTIDYSNVTKGIFAGNVVVTASGITFSGTNTNTSRINNLQGTVFA